MLAEIEQEARTRWPLEASLVIHRYGRLEPGDRIVMVAAASAHRQAAFAASAFLMDWLKTKEPFWKLEETSEGAQWVDAPDSNDKHAAHSGRASSRESGRQEVSMGVDEGHIKT